MIIVNLPRLRLNICKIFFCAFLSALGASVTIVTFAPGVITSDTVDIINQIAAGKWNDWHSPFFTYILSLTRPISFGPYGMLIANCALLWAACGILVCASMKRYGWRALLFFLIPIVPSALFIPAFAWDVTFHSMTWFLALSLGFIYVKRVSFKPNTIQILMLALIFIGTMVRKNGWFAALPLFFLALSPMGGGKGRMGLAAFFFILVPIMWGVAALLFKATPSHPENSIKTYDIGSISAFTDQNLFPGVWTKSQSRDIVENCYENDVKKRILDNGWDVYAWGRCGFVLRNLSEQKLFKSNVLTAAWLSAVFGHPVAYLRARLEFFGTFMVAHKSIPVLMYSESNAKFGWDFRNKKMIKAAYDFASLFVGGALFRPITWLILNFVAFVLAFKVRDSMARCFVCCVSLSGVVWLLTYFNFGVAYDFRYAFWAIYAALLSIVVVANELAAQLRAARFGFR